jgi:hypothetical protein
MVNEPPVTANEDGQNRERHLVSTRQCFYYRIIPIDGIRVIESGVKTEVLKISRTKLYYKTKGLTGNNPNVFFKTYKLNCAAELLAEGKYNISEIADITGFSTLSHFSTSFKKQFGVSPSEFG